MLGWLFRPDLGGCLRPLNESHRVFVHMVACVFRIHGLLPLDQPDPVSLTGVLRLGWQDLRLTPKNIPRLFLFGAVTGCLALSALLVLTAAAVLLLDPAQAAPAADHQGMFDPLDKDRDLATSWIDYLFLGREIVSTVNAAGIHAPQATTLQKALNKALAFYSHGILILAGFILLYYLTRMIAETALHGVAFGRNTNPFWAPIRLVVAIGLLVPVGNLGLNTGQYVVIQIAKWGSGLASQTWQILLEGLGANNFTYRMPNVPSGIDHLVNNLMRISACQQAFNAQIATAGLDESYKIGAKATNPAQIRECARLAVAAGVGYGLPGTVPPECRKTDLQPTTWSFGNKEMAKLCGSYDLTPPPESPSAQMTDMVQRLWEAHRDAINTTQPIITEVAKHALLYLPEPDRLKEPPNNLTPHDAITMYRDSLQASMNEIKVEWNARMNKISHDWASQGWVTAGMWFNTIARAQGAVINAADSPMPVTYPPLAKVNDASWFAIFSRDQQNAVRSIYETTQDAVAAFNKNLIEPAPLVGKSREAEELARTGLPRPTPDKGEGDVRAVLASIDWLGQKLDLWDSGDGLAHEFGKTSNPLAELALYGYRHVEFGLDMIVWGAGGSVASGFIAKIPWVGDGLANLGIGISGIVMTLGAIFMAGGFALAYMVPMIPFIKFFFNVLTWLLNLFEAIVSIPLFALAHLTPEGEGLPGSLARGGYYYLLSLLLRPVLMIFGLAAGLLLFFIGINFLNYTFSVATQGSGSAGGGLAVLSKIVFSIMYIALAYICANKSFQTISFFAEHSLKWLGVSGVETRPMGDPGFMQGAVGPLTGIIAERMLMNTAQNLAGSIPKFHAPHRGDEGKGKKETDDTGGGPKGGPPAGGGATAAHHPQIPSHDERAMAAYNLEKSYGIAHPRGASPSIPTSEQERIAQALEHSYNTTRIQAHESPSEARKPEILLPHRQSNRKMPTVKYSEEKGGS